MVNLGLPKFSITSQYNLKEDLQDMGVRSVFSQTAADFRRMTTAQVYISKVLHKVMGNVVGW